MENHGIFYDHLAYFTAIVNILWPFGISFLVLVFWTKKNLATLARRFIKTTNFYSYSKRRSAGKQLQRKIGKNVHTLHIVFLPKKLPP
jgi:hypothetical protein